MPDDDALIVRNIYIDIFLWFDVKHNVINYALVRNISQKELVS